MKAVVIRLDNSGALENVDRTNHTVILYKGANNTTPVSLLDPSNNPAITGCTLLLPNPPTAGG